MELKDEHVPLRDIGADSDLDDIEEEQETSGRFRSA